MADYGVKVTKPGKDISSTDMRDFTIHSGVNMLKVFMSGAGVASVTSKSYFSPGPWTLNVSHNLGYKPQVIFFFQHPDNSRWHRAVCVADANTDAAWNMYGNVTHADINTVQLRLYDGVIDSSPSSPFNVNYKYYIMADPRQDTWYAPAGSDSDNGNGVSDYGLKISRPGISVQTAEDKNLVFSSGMYTLKEYRVIKFDYDASRSPANIEEKDHGLDYPPTFIPIKENSVTAGRYEVATLGYYEGGVSSVFVDTTKVYYNRSEECYIILAIDPLNE